MNGKRSNVNQKRGSTVLIMLHKQHRAAISSGSVIYANEASGITHLLEIHISSATRLELASR